MVIPRARMTPRRAGGGGEVAVGQQVAVLPRAAPWLETRKWGSPRPARIGSAVRRRVRGHRQHGPRCTAQRKAPLVRSR